MGFHFLTLALALAIDRRFGEPEALWGKIPHPIIWFGKALEKADGAFNAPDASLYIKRRNGFLVILILMLVAGGAGALLHFVFAKLGFFGLILEALIASVFLAHKSLVDHVSAVAYGLENGGLAGGREAVSRIVGRDPASLDEAGVCRAAIESLAENFADGVVAPAFWYLVAGLPGLLAYKMLNTADSMIGHMNDKYRDFGRASAKFDDAANFIPARLTGGAITVAALIMYGARAGKRALATMMRDARLHRSPNSGWPEAAMAGAQNLALAGPRIYKGDVANEPMLNSSGRRDAKASDIIASVALINVIQAAIILTVLVLAALL